MNDTLSMLTGLRILMVEDNEDSRELIAMLLSAKGAEVREAASGEEAVEIAKSWAPDVIVLDLQLPGIDGVEALRQIRSVTALSSVPAIAVTGAGTPGDRARTLEAGFEKHLLKPVATSDMIAALTVLATAADPTDDVRAMLESLNANGACQYTSVLRFAKDGTLISVWTYDRDAPKTDAFALGFPTTDSYCLLVRDTRQPTIVEDARTDPRLTQHPKREQLAAYLGVPIFDDRGEMFGTLCSYDVGPQQFSPAIRAQHEAAAKQLASIVARWG